MEGTNANRRVSKPLMEKRRRARINQSLAELKLLIMDDIKSETPRHSKLEKADILEMTVKHLKELHKHKRVASILSRETVRDKFRAGYEECINEIENFFSSFERPTSTTSLNDQNNNHRRKDRSNETRQRILRFLGNKLERITVEKLKKSPSDSGSDSDGYPSPSPDRPGTADSSASRPCFCSRVGSLRLLLVPSEYGHRDRDVIGVSSTNEIEESRAKSLSRPARPDSSTSSNSAGFSSVVSSSSHSTDESSNCSSDESEQRAKMKTDKVQTPPPRFNERVDSSAILMDNYEDNFARDEIREQPCPILYSDPLWRPW